MGAEQSFIIAADHQDHGLLYAAVDPAAHHVTGKPSVVRFAALLAPFATREDAEAALIAEGGTLREGGAR